MMKTGSEMESRKILFAILTFSFVLFIIARLLFDNIFVYTFALHLGMLFFALFFLYDKDRADLFRKLGIPGELKKNALFAIGGLLATFISLGIITVMFGYLGLDDQAQVTKIVNQLPLSVVALAVLLAPFSEEMLFRGLLTPRFGIVPSSLAFAIVHISYGSIAEITGAFMIGMIFAIVFKKSGSIMPCIAIHLVYNAVSLAVLRGMA